MEPLNLQSGRFLPSPNGTSEERIRALEAALADLSSDLEYLLAVIHAALERSEAASGRASAAET